MTIQQFAFDFLRILIGNAWNRTGSALALLGASALTGWIDQLVGALFHVDITQTAAWIGFAVMLTEIGMLAYAKAWPQTTPAVVASHDVQLLMQYRALITDRLVRFLSLHSYRDPFRNEQIEPIEIIADEWNTAHYEFDNTEVQAALVEVRQECSRFSGLVGVKLFLEGRLLSPLTGIDKRFGITTQTRANIAELNATSRRLAETLNSFERVARQNIS